MKKLRSASIAALGLLWLTGIGLATREIMRVERQPGAEPPVAARWPARSGLARSTEGPTLVMVAHPKCPCTRAGLEQLAEIAARSKLDGIVLFVRPAELSPTWVRTPLWSLAAEIPGFTPVEDPDGRLAALFGGVTSGHVFLYDSQGALRFSGGITSGRGVSGPSAGSASLLAWLGTGAARFDRTPVYGCPVVSR